MRLILLVQYSVLTILLGVFSLQAWAERNMGEVPGDHELDESALIVLERVKRPVNVALEAWEDILKQYKIKMERNVPVHFYGKVVDQNMKPLRDVRVFGFVRSFDTAYLEKLAPGTGEQIEYEWTVMTDKNGVFAVRGFRGLSLHIRKFERDGYAAPSYKDELFLISEKHYGKEAHKAIQDQPVVFKMWTKDKTDHAEDLIRREIKISGPADGREYRVDLTSGSCVTNTGNIYDVSIKVVSASLNANPDTKYDWSFSLSMPDGGLVFTDDPHPFEAPEGGYISLVISEHSSADKIWSRSEKRRYYIRSRGGALYAMIDVTVYAYRDGKSLVRIDSVANANGSRNLMTLR